MFCLNHSKIVTYLKMSTKRKLTIVKVFSLQLFFFFLAVLGLRCCAWAFCSCGERGLRFVALCGASHCGGFSCCGVRALGTQASVVVARRLSSCGSRALERRLSSCGAWAQLLRSVWDLPGPGLEPMSPALAGTFLTTVPPGKPSTAILESLVYLIVDEILELKTKSFLQFYGYMKKRKYYLFSGYKV